MANQDLENDQPDFSQAWDFSDVVLKVEEERFHVHRSILAMWSPVFSRMFTSEFTEKTAQEVPLPEKKSSEIKEMLLVIYPTSSKRINENNYSFLLDLAREYMMKKLTEKCEEFLMDKFSSPNKYRATLCLDLLDTAQSYGLERLQEACINKAQNITLWELKNHYMYNKINLPNYREIVERIIQRMQGEIQQLDSKVRYTKKEWTKVESSASNALNQFEEMISLLVQVVRDSSKGPYQRLTDPLERKIDFIVGAKGTFAHFKYPLSKLKSELECLRGFGSSHKNN